MTSTGTSFDISITGDELYSALQLLNFRSVRGMMRAIVLDSTRLALSIHRITSAKKMREVWPVVLVGESSAQLLMYLLDTLHTY